MASTCQAIVNEVGLVWARAVKHEFAERCADGTIGSEQVDTWLNQDAIWARGLTRLVGSMLCTAPDEDLDILLDTLAAMHDEMCFYETKAFERGLSREVVPLGACETYLAFMEKLRSAPYPVQLGSLWAVRAVYNQAWQAPRPMGLPLRRVRPALGFAGVQRSGQRGRTPRRRRAWPSYRQRPPCRS